MALLNGKNAVSLAAMMAFGLATTPGGSVRLGAGWAAELPAIGSAAAATRKKVVKKSAAPKKPATTKRVCTTAKVKGKLVKSCKTVKIVPVPVVVVPPPVVITTVNPVPVQTVVVRNPPPPISTPQPQRPAPIAQPPASSYFPIDLADSLAGAIGDAPPDFVIRYDGIESWVWLSRSGEMLIVEPGREGIVQYYFIGGGSAPYLVRDGYNAFAFSGPELIQVYDDRGRLFTGELSRRQNDVAFGLFDRGRALFSASWRQRGWSGDSALQWYDTIQRDNYAWSGQSGWRGNWRGDWRRRPDWQSFEYDQFSQMPPRYLDDERQRRRDSTYRYDRWRRDGARGAPPPTANPVIQNPAPVSPAEAGPRPGPPPAPAPRPQPRPPVVTPPPAPAPAPAPAPVPTPQPGWRQPAAPTEVSPDREPRPPEFPRRRPQPQPAPPPPPPAPIAQPVQVEQAPVVQTLPPPPPPPPPAPAPAPVEVTPPPPPTPPAPVVVAPPPPPPPPAPPPPAPPPVPAVAPEPPAAPDVPVTVDEGAGRQDPVNEQRP